VVTGLSQSPQCHRVCKIVGEFLKLSDKSHEARPKIPRDLLEFLMKITAFTVYYWFRLIEYHIRSEKKKKWEFTSRNIALRRVTNVYDLQPLTSRSHNVGHFGLDFPRSSRRAEKMSEVLTPKM